VQNPTPAQPRMIARGRHLFYEFPDGRVLPVIRGGATEQPTLAELLAQAANPEGIEDDTLAQLDADITGAAEALAAGDLDDEALAQLTQAGEAVQAIRAEQEAREQAAAERAEQAQAALALIRGESDTDPEGDPEDEPADDDADEPATPEAEVPAEVPAPEAEAEVPAPEAVAASTPPAPRRPVTRVAARRPAQAAPRQSVTAGGGLASLGMVASANAPGVQAGQPITSYDQLAAAFVSAVDATKGYRHGPPVKVPVVRIGQGDTQYPEAFRLDGDLAGNQRRIEAAQRAIQEAGGLQAAITASAQDASRTAAGGICAPQQVNYDMPTLGTDARAMRDGFMARFGADRGGIRTLPMPLLGDLSGAIGVWTEANDQNPADPTTKPCLTVTCPDEDETIVEAITRCLEYGNFRARYFPEQIEAWMRLVAVEHARYAEQRLMATVSTGSTAVTSGQVLGTSRDVLAALDRAIAVWRYRHRLGDGYRLEFGAPIWLRDQIRTDITRQLPVGTVEETLAVADATIARFFAVRNIEPVWLLDGESGQRFVAQGAGPLQGWPSTVKTYLAPAGGWLFLDGGTLDLGIVRDSTLNATNDVQVFAETFEGAHFHGPESWTLTFDTCPDGSVSATVDISPCSTGS